MNNYFTSARLIITVQFCIIVLLAGYWLRTTNVHSEPIARNETGNGSMYNSYRKLLLNNNKYAFIENDSVISGVIADEVTYTYYRKDHIQTIQCLDVNMVNYYTNIMDRMNLEYYVDRKGDMYIIAYNGDMYIPDLPEGYVNKSTSYERFNYIGDTVVGNY